MTSKNHGFTWAAIAAMTLTVLVPVSIHFHNCVRTTTQAKELKVLIRNVLNPPHKVVIRADDWV